jgi:hypothetical protein
VQIEFDLRKIVTPTGSLAVPLGACGDRARLCTAVRGTVSLSEGTLLEFPGSYFETARERENARTVQHELMHALGFGHGCYWPSIMMYTGPACAATFPEEPSAYDIAYVEFVQTLAGTLAVHPDAWHLAEARP